MRSWRRTVSVAALLTAAAGFTSAVSGDAALGAVTGASVTWSVTTGDGMLLANPQAPVTFGPATSTDYSWSDIAVNDDVSYQQVRGMGAALTESSAVLIDSLPADVKARVLDQLFNPVSGAGISVLRVPLGASDFALSDYTLDDLPKGHTDLSLTHFSVDRDRLHIIPLIMAAKQINPKLSVIVTPWSAPAWMKTNGSTHGGSLAAKYEDVYSQYLVRAVTEYRNAGVPVDALTIQNEPEFATASYPSMSMTAAQETRIVGTRLRPALNAAGLGTVSILGFDHNWSDTTYPTSLVTGTYAGAFAGAAFHCYAGDESNQSTIAAASPGKQVWTTECTGGTWSPDFAGNLRWNAHHMLVGAFRNYSSVSMFWNIALNPQGGPTNGGCTTCRGVLTIDPTTASVTPNVEYWLLAHIGRFVEPGATRVSSTASNPTGVQSVAFRNPDGSHALFLFNEGGSPQPVTVRFAGEVARVSLDSGAIATLHW